MMATFPSWLRWRRDRTFTHVKEEEENAYTYSGCECACATETPGQCTHSNIKPEVLSEDADECYGMEIQS